MPELTLMQGVYAYAFIVSILLVCGYILLGWKYFKAKVNLQEKDYYELK